MYGGFEVALGPLGKPPTFGTPVDISRGGLKTRTRDSVFDCSAGTEYLIRFRDPHGRLAPDRTLAWVRRIEEKQGQYLVSLEFTHPLERVSI